MLVLAISFCFGVLICYGGAELVNESAHSKDRYKYPGMFAGAIILLFGVTWCILILGYKA